MQLGWLAGKWDEHRHWRRSRYPNHLIITQQGTSYLLAIPFHPITNNSQLLVLLYSWLDFPFFSLSLFPFSPQLTWLAYMYATQHTHHIHIPHGYSISTEVNEWRKTDNISTLSTRRWWTRGPLTWLWVFCFLLSCLNQWMTRISYISLSARS